MLAFFEMRLPLTVTIITLNEEAHISAAIRSVSGWAEEVLVVDSGSKDDTLRIAKELGARVLTNAWKGYGQQKNFAQDQASHDWVLNLDADERATDALKKEIDEQLNPIELKLTSAAAFAIPRKNFYLGRWIRFGGWYPNRLVRLADRRRARWSEPDVHEVLTVAQGKGRIKELRQPIEHFGFLAIHDQIETNARYSRLGAQLLLKQGRKSSLTKLILKPLGKFIETYLFKRGFLDGLPGFIISVNAAYSMFMKYSYLIESDLREDSHRR